MALLTFPFPVADGTIYPVSPPAGTNIYRWDGTDQTWRLLGPASGVTAGTYGTPLSVPQITIDATGRITVAVDVPIQLGDTTQVGLVQLVDDLISNDPTKALTAAQGFVLSNEIGDTSLLNPFYPNLVTAVNALGAPSGVTAGTYGNSTNVGRFTVNAQGRITSATNVPLALATAISPGVVRVGANLSVTPTGVLSVPNANTAQRGVVQLVNDTVTNDNTKALTAAAGYDLQLQIDALEARNNLTFAGTISGATGLMLSVTAQGAALGFVVGAALPLPSVLNDEYFVVVTVPGTFTPTGGAPQATNDGDWFVSDGSQWLYYNVGPTVAAATFIQLDDISGQFNNTRVSFVLRVSGTAYTPASASAILLSVGGVIQIPGASFTLAGSTVTFSEAPKTNTTFVGYAVSGLTGGGGGGGGGGTGTVTSVGTGTGLIGGPVTTTGTISLRPATNSTLGGVIPDNTTITISPTGVISASSAGVGTLQSVTNNGATTTNAINVGGLSSTGNMVFGDSSSDTISVPARFASSLIPNANEVYDLGSATNRWRDLYVSSNSIYMGTNQLTVSGGQLLLNGSVVGGGGSVGTLQTVTNNGATTTNSITLSNASLTVNNSSGGLVTNFAPTSNYTTAPSTFAAPSSGTQVTINNGALTATNTVSGASVSLGSSGVTFNNGGGFGNGVNIAGPSGLGIFYSLVLPPSQGAAGTTLVNDGLGNLSWGTGGGSVGTLQTVTDNGATTTRAISSAKILVADGSTAAPSISFQSSPGTGIRYDSTGGVLSVVDGGSVELTIGNNQTTLFSDIIVPNSYTASFTGTLSFLQSGGNVRFYDFDNSNYVGFRGPSVVTSNVSWILPSADGTSGQVLTTNGAGVLSWASGSGAVSTLQQVTTAGNTTSTNIVIDNGSTKTILSPGSIAFNQTINNIQYVGQDLYLRAPNGGNFRFSDYIGGVDTLTFRVNQGGGFTSFGAGTITGDLTLNKTGGSTLTFDTNGGTINFNGTDDAFITQNSGLAIGTATVGTTLKLQTQTGFGPVTRVEVSGASTNISNQLVASGLSYPTSDGTSGQVLTTNGTGTLGWLSTARVVAVPANSGSGGAAGQIAFGNGFFYWFDTASGQWLRVAGNTF